MRVKANQDIRQKIKESDFFTYEVAAKLGLGENTLIRHLRTEFSEEEKQRVLIVLKELEEESKN